MSRGAAKESFAAPRLMRFSKLVTTAFSRGYILSPLRGFRRKKAAFSLEAGNGYSNVLERNFAAEVIEERFQVRRAYFLRAFGHGLVSRLVDPRVQWPGRICSDE